MYRLGRELVKNSPAEDLGVMVHGKPNMGRYYVLTVQKANHVLGCIPSR